MFCVYILFDVFVRNTQKRRRACRPLGELQLRRELPQAALHFLAAVASARDPRLRLSGELRGSQGRGFEHVPLFYCVFLFFIFEHVLPLEHQRRRAELQGAPVGAGVAALQRAWQEGIISIVVSQNIYIYISLSLSLCLSLSLYIYIERERCYIYIYIEREIYIYIYREREIEIYTCVCIYIYRERYICIYTRIHIYIYRGRETESDTERERDY